MLNPFQGMSREELISAMEAHAPIFQEVIARLGAARAFDYYSARVAAADANAHKVFVEWWTGKFGRNERSMTPAENAAANRVEDSAVHYSIGYLVGNVERSWIHAMTPERKTFCGFTLQDREHWPGNPLWDLRDRAHTLETRDCPDCVRKLDEMLNGRNDAR